jgi:hypothetical protein
MPARSVRPKIHVAAAVNETAVLENCLARSPDIVGGGLPLSVYRDFKSASLAYNAAFDEISADYILFVHQDVYLPTGFHRRLTDQIAKLAARDPNWAVMGVIGIDPAGDVRGQTWSSGLGTLVGVEVAQATEVVTIDEVMFLVRTGAGVRFDNDLPTFHLYGADIVQAARARGMKSYVAHLPVIHHSRPTVRLDGSYRRAYRYMQRKWRDALPLPNLICTIDASPIPLLMRDLRIRWRYRGRTERKEPEGDPAEIARNLNFEAVG